jgi:hypothetical protein
MIGCKATHYTPKTYRKTQIIAGSSGGVTGVMKEYVLLDNGQLFLGKGISGDWRELKKLKHSTTKDIFEKAESLGIRGMKYNHPGNMTYYLILKDPSRTYQVKWGETGVAPPDGIAEFYNYLLSVF